MPKKRRKPRKPSPSQNRPAKELAGADSASKSLFTTSLQLETPASELAGLTRTPRPGGSSNDGDMRPSRPDDRELTFVAVPFAALADQAPQALGLSYAFDAPPPSVQGALRIRFVGHRLEAEKPTAEDSFDVAFDVPTLPPNVGPVSVTMRVVDIPPGKWSARAEVELDGSLTGSRTWRPPSAAGTGRTGFAPVVRSRAPGVVLGAWPALVLFGTVCGLALQALLARHLRLPATRSTLLLLLACLIGTAGAKLYFLLLHRDRQAKGLPMTGMAIQGFVLAALGTAATGAAGLNIPVRGLLDVSAPGLLVGMAIGRWGCYFGGCCAGRPTSSRWGRWSSNRTLGVRRIPTQLLESGWAATLAALATTVLWAGQGTPQGVVFVIAIAAYTAGRQLLLPLRDLPRTTSTGRHWVLAFSCLATVAALSAAIVERTV